MRIACLHIPDFPLAAWLRAEPELRGAPLIVTEGPGPRARVVACSAEALGVGVTPGLTAAQAQAIASGLVVRAAAPDAEHAAQAALCDVAYSCSPRVEEGGIGTVYVDAGGLRELYATEAELARALVGRARAIGLEVAVGIAATKIAAQLGACDGGSCTVIPPHEEWRYLAPLPIHLLAPDAALRQTLARWGLRTLGDLAALPASAVATRLGPDGAALARRARGEDAHPLAPRPLPLCFEESAELDYGVDHLEPFLFVVRGLLDRLTARLALRGLICGDLRLTLGLATRGCDARTVAVAAPSNEIKPLLTLVRLHLEAHPPAAAIESVRLAAVPERLRPAQLDLFRPNGPAPAQLAVTLARLTALCGPDRLGAPGRADSYRPEAYALREFSLGVPRSASRVPPAPTASDLSPSSTPNAQRPTRNDPTPIAIRALRPPIALDVFCQRDRPDFVRPADIVREAPATYGCSGRVVTLAGPWRLHADWWRPDVLHRDYYDAQLSDGVVYRLFFDRTDQRWFADGVYD